MLSSEQVAEINTAMELGPLEVIRVIVAARDALPTFEERLAYWVSAQHYAGLGP